MHFNFLPLRSVSSDNIANIKSWNFGTPLLRIHLKSINFFIYHKHQRRVPSYVQSKLAMFFHLAPSMIWESSMYTDLLNSVFENLLWNCDWLSHVTRLILGFSRKFLQILKANFWRYLVKCCDILSFCAMHC